MEDDEQVLEWQSRAWKNCSIKWWSREMREKRWMHLRGPDRIDIMFSDVVMPGGMNGAQLAVEARTLRPELKVLLTSGYVGEGASIFVDEGLPILNKPYRRDELAEKLHAVLGSPVQGKPPH